MISMIKGYSFDIDTNGKEIDEDYLVKVIGKALKLEGIELVGLGWQANWKDMDDYEENIQLD